MFNEKNLIKRMGLIVMLVACGFVFLGQPNPAQTEEHAPDYVEKAKYDAEKARADAEKDMAEAEMAMEIA